MILENTSVRRDRGPPGCPQTHEVSPVLATKPTPHPPVPLSLAGRGDDPGPNLVKLYRFSKLGMGAA
jgi:hypothetical protein